MIVPDTAIMATLTLGQCTPEFIGLLTSRGMAGVRINSAHVNAGQLTDMVNSIRDAAPWVTVLTDTKGAEVRTTDAPIPVEFIEGMEAVVCYAPQELCVEGTICVNAPDLQRYVHIGQIMTIDDGALRMEVVSVGDGSFRVKALNNGILESRKGVSFPGIDPPHLPSVTENDREAIIAAREAGVDLIAHSFVRTARDVEAVKELVEGTSIKVYAKIECASALRNLDEIMDVADGILFARGDLGTAIPIETIPVVQQKVMDLCAKRRLPVILSTQILRSMMTNPMPTRAEVTDMYTGVMQGASWMLLCGETAEGRYPVECVDIMRRTIEATRDYMLSL